MFRCLCAAAHGVPVGAAFLPSVIAQGCLLDVVVPVPAIPGDRVGDDEGLCALAVEIATPIDRNPHAIQVLPPRLVQGQGRVTVDGAAR